jgi:hypothetical protein
MSQQPDNRPGNYYVTVTRDDGQYRLLLGPFHFHRQALDMVDPVSRYVANRYAADPRAPWYAYGTARLPLDITRPNWQTPPGLLNDAPEEIRYYLPRSAQP